MTLYAYVPVVPGPVREIMDVPTGLVPGKDVYTAELAARMVPCDSSVVVGSTTADGKTFAPPPAPPPPTPAAVYATALAAGLAIVSTATPALDGTYDISDPLQSKIQAIVVGVGAGKGLPGGGATFNWLDAGGVPHPFSAADFTNFAAAAENYVYQLAMTEAALLGGHAASWPVAAAAIP